MADESIPLSADELAGWWERIDLAIEARKHHESRWDALLRAYLPVPTTATTTGAVDAINSNTHFRNTEQKKAQLFFRTPDVVLTAKEPLRTQVMGPDGQPHTPQEIVSIKTAVLNNLLGRDGVDAKRLIDECLFDLLQPAGLAATKICYEADFVPVETEQPTGQQVPLEGSVLGLQTVPEMQTVTVDVPIHEEWTWKRFSPKKLLIPHDWHSTRYDEAPWIGLQFVKSLAVAKREYKLPDDFESNTTHDGHVFRPYSDTTDAKSSAPVVEGVEIWYRPAFFPDTGVAHRQVQRRLVLIKQLEDRPAVHTASPYQTLGPDGRLTHDSLIGFPIHVFTLRDLSDSAYVPSDAAMTDPLVRQKNTWRAQDLKRRDANIPRFLFDGVIKEALEKLENADVGEGAEVPAGTLQGGIERLIAELPKVEKAIADVQGEASIERDIQETLALGPNQAGSVNQKVLSATEISAAQATAGARAQAEQNRLLGDFLTGVRKFDALVMRYADQQDYVEWVGADGAKRLSAWNKDLIAGRWSYDIKPDSSKQVDVAQERAVWQQALNLTANAPETNRVEVLRRYWEKLGEDGSKMVVPPSPKKSEPPKLQLSFNGQDLVGPQAPIVIEILQQNGVTISPNAVLQAQAMAQQDALLAAASAAKADERAQPQTEHGGALEGSPGGLRPISKHAGELTGAPVGRGPM